MSQKYTELNTIEDVKEARAAGAKVQFRYEDGTWGHSGSALRENWSQVESMLSRGYKYRALGYVQLSSAWTPDDFLCAAAQAMVKDLTGIVVMVVPEDIGPVVSRDVAMRAVRMALEKGAN